MEIVKCEYKIIGDLLEVTPEDEIKKNSKYEIKISGIKNKDGSIIDPVSFTFISVLSPMYCTIEDIDALINIKDVSDFIVMKNIKAASEYAAYIYGQTINGEPPFKIRELARFRAAKMIIMKLYAQGIMPEEKGQMGDTSYSFKLDSSQYDKLLKRFEAEEDKWKAEVLELGKAVIKSANRGKKGYLSTPLSYNRSEGN